MAKQATGKVDDPNTPEDESVEEVPEIVPDPTKHILVDMGKTGEYELEEQPRGFRNDYRLLLRGQNIETVGISTHGVRQYRAM